MHILLTEDGAADVEATCEFDKPPPHPILLVGRVASSDLSQPLVQVKDVKLLTAKKPAAGEARHPTDCVAKGIDVRVPRSAIRAARNTDP